MKYLLILAAVLCFAMPAAAQFSVNPNVGAAYILKDGETTRVGELLADLGYGFALTEDGKWYGEMLALYGISDVGSQLGGLGFRTYVQQGGVYPGLGVQMFVVDAGTVPGIDKTSITVAPEVLLEIPWSSETVLEDGTILIEESMVAAYGAVYFPVSGEDFTMLRFGIRVGI